MTNTRIKPVVLVILDGWGIAPDAMGNAISQAETPTIDGLWHSFPHTTLEASGESVGLPHGEDGNTETGHLNLGAGKIVYQDLPRINQSIADGSYFTNPQFIGAIQHVQKNQSTLHLMGLIGSGGVHSNTDHLHALLNICQQHHCTKVALHLITDGRDSPPTSGINYIRQIRHRLKELGFGTISTIMGRYYAMDRDNNWDRTEIAYRAMTAGEGKEVHQIEDEIINAYQNQETDEFIKPRIIHTNDSPPPLIQKNDAIIFFNFRIDRPRQLTKAFVYPNFEYISSQKEGFDPHAVNYHHTHNPQKPQQKVFDRGDLIPNLYFVTMTEYEKGLPVSIAFPPELVEMPLGRVVSDMGLRQLRMSETEKERFVTYYFNGQRDDPFPGEDRIIIPSPPVPTYDQKPEMSSRELTQTLIERIQANTYDCIIVNYANPDMVAHSGNLKAGILACQVTDENIRHVTDTVSAMGGVTIITADHGNIEEMLDLQTGSVDTKHSTNPVPFIIVGQQFLNKSIELPSGILADVAPTILDLLNLPIPTSMSGRSLVQGILQ